MSGGVFPGLFFASPAVLGVVRVEEEMPLLNIPYIVKQSFFCFPGHHVPNEKTYIKRGHKLILQFINEEKDIYSFDIVLLGDPAPTKITLSSKSVNTFLRPLTSLPNSIWNSINV